MPIFTNQAFLSYDSSVVASNITSGELRNALTATKTAVRDTYRADGTVTYIVSILNYCPTARNNLIVTDDLGGYSFGTQTLYPLSYTDGSVRYYLDGVLQPAPTVVAGPPLVISGISIPAGSNALFIYEASVTSFAPPTAGSTIDNTVTITGGGLAEAVTATETVTAESGPVLTISKSLSPLVVCENIPITYTLTIRNSGNAPAVATDNVVVTDTFDPVLSNLVVTYNGEVWSSPADYTYDPATGLFSTNIGAITVPAATFTQDPVTGVYAVTPGISVITVTGTI